MSDQQQPDRIHTGPRNAGGPGNADDHDQRVEPQKAFEELSKLVLGEQSLTAVLQRVAELAKTTIPDTHEVSVTLMKDSQSAETTGNYPPRSRPKGGARAGRRRESR